jgi:DNA polymerase
MTLATLDFETYSEAGFVWSPELNKWTCLPNASQGRKGLPIVGAARYAEHPTTEVLCAAYDLGDGPRLWTPDGLPPVDLFAYIREGGLLEAWNSSFEYHIWQKVCRRLYGWPDLPQSQLRCAMSKSRAHALPGALGKAAEVLGTKSQKDKDGERLIRLFCSPRDPTKKDPRRRILPAEEPEEAAKLYAYCLGDIAAEAEISALIPDLPPEELANWQMDQRINWRGVAVDTEGISACRELIGQAHERYNRELYVLTDGVVARASELQKLMGWLHGLGVHTDSLDEEHCTGLLAGNLPPVARRALEIRAAAGSAAVKKVYAMRNTVCADGRLHDLFLYHAARTGRTTGAGPQPTNLPNSGPELVKCPVCLAWYGLHLTTCPQCGAERGGTRASEWNPEAVEFVLSVASARSLDLMELYFGDSMAAVSGCLRGLFVAAPGHDLICSDYSAIEAVVLAELAGEAWRQEVFRTHGKIYEMSAAKISGVPFEEFMRHAGYVDEELSAPDWYKRKPSAPGKHHPLRKTVGKVAELASGFQGWIGAWLAFGADAFMSEEEIKQAILAWRAASPAIVEFWGGQERNRKPDLYGVEGAFLSATIHPGEWYWFRGLGFCAQNGTTYIRLLSGRLLTYHRVQTYPSERRANTLTLSYEGWNTNPKNGPAGWQRFETWGGRLTENIVQATARDIQWHGMRALEAAGYPVVLHVYDEDVAEVPEGFGSVAEFERIMSDMPSWAPGWPIRANGGWRGKRYRK